MNGKIQKFIMLIFLICCVFSACSKKPEPDVESPDPTFTPTPTETVYSGLKEIMIYTLNPDSCQKEAIQVTASDERKITVEYILEKTIESLEDNAFYIDIDYVKTEDRNIIISFKEGMLPSSGADENVEKLILEIIGQSLLDNLKEYDGIIYRLGGNAYVSSGLSYGIDEVYISR